MQANVHAPATPTTDPLDEASTDRSSEPPLALDVPPLDDDGTGSPVDAGADALDTHIVEAADIGDEVLENKLDREWATSAMIGDEESALGDEAMALANEAVDDDEIVRGDERGLLKDSDEPDGRALDAREAGIDDDEATTSDDGGAEGPRDPVEALVAGDRASAWDRLDRGARAALRAAVGMRSLEATIEHENGYFVAIVDDTGERGAVLALRGGACATVAELDLAGAGDVRAIAIDGDEILVTLTRGERRVAIPAASS
jgi:hypothetical protein